MLAPRDKLWAAPVWAVDAALAALELKPTDHLVDYGCGDGVALMRAASTIGCRATGYEICEERVEQLQRKLAEPECAEFAMRITVKCVNALEADPTEPTAVYMYLISRGLKMMMPLLKKAADTQPDHVLRVVTLLYPIPGEIAIRTLKIRDPSKPDIMFPIYVYSIHASPA